MPNMAIPVNSLDELRVIQLWLRETRGMWTPIDKTTLHDGGDHWPLYSLELDRGPLRHILSAQFVDRRSEEPLSPVESAETTAVDVRTSDVRVGQR